jgi:NhaP-type Na+/H+ or K+/H+ antiporter
MDYAAIALLIGAIASLIEERVGKFQEMSPGQKQAINAVVTYFLPLAVTFLATYVDPKYSGADQTALAGLVMLAAPVVCWGASQLAHWLDKTYIQK